MNGHGPRTVAVIFTLMLLPAFALAAGAPFTVWAVDDMVKINPQSGVAFEQKQGLYKTANTESLKAANWIWDGKTVAIEGARNEAIGWQIIVEPAEGTTLHEVTCVAGAFKGSAPDAQIPAENITFYRAWYIPVTKTPFAASLGLGHYPDALIPFSFGSAKRGAPFPIPDSANPVPDQKNQSIFVDVYVPAGTRPGDYSGTITVKSTEGAVTLPVKLMVYSFTMPQSHAFHYWGFSYGNVDGKADNNVRLEYYRIAQAHRFFVGVISSPIHPRFNVATGAMDFTDYDAKVGPLFDGSAFTREQGYAPGPGMGQPVTDYSTPIAWDPARVQAKDRRSSCWPMSEKETSAPGGEAKLIAALQTYYKHLEAKGWTKNTRDLIFINGLDEPRGKADLQKIYDYGDWVAKANVPLYYGIAINGFNHVLGKCGTNLKDFVGHVSGMNYIDWMTTTNGDINSPFFADDLKANPKHICNFDGCREPADGSPHTDTELMGLRVNPWMSRHFSPLFNGYVLWSVDLGDDKVWSDADNYNGKMNGMAFLIYPAEASKKGVGLPVPSIRCKALRRGLQDYEMMHALDVTGQGAAVQEIVDSVIQGGWDKQASGKFETDAKLGQWSHNPRAWYVARHKLLQLVSGASRN